MDTLLVGFNKQCVMVVISIHELVYSFLNKLKAITIEMYDKQHKNKNTEMKALFNIIT